MSTNQDFRDADDLIREWLSLPDDDPVAVSFACDLLRYEIHAMGFLNGGGSYEEWVSALGFDIDDPATLEKFTLIHTCWMSAWNLAPKKVLLARKAIAIARIGRSG